MSDEILNSLDFTDFDICINCIKGKQTNKRRFEANRTSNVLELIHTDICGPFPTAAWNGQQYFITFIDDFSRYGYIYLLKEKAQSLDVFKNYKAEVKNQLSKKGLKASDQTVVVNTMVDMTVQVNNVQNHLLNS